MRRRWRTSLLGLAVAGALAPAGGCKSDKDDGDKPATEAGGQKITEKTAETAAPVGGDALIKRIDECRALIESWQKEQLRACFVDKPEVAYIDSVVNQRATTAAEAIVQIGILRNSFRDFKLESALVLVNQKKSAEVVRLAGSHKAVGKDVSLFQALVADHDEQGRSTRVRFYVDESTIFHQLGILESATATSGEKAWPEPAKVVAKNDAAESANLAAVKAGIEALAKKDVPGALAVYADDAVYRYIPEGRPYVGKKEVEERLGANLALDYKLSIGDAWAAGDWVVVEITTAGTLREDVPGAKGSKGKAWELNTLELYRLAGGKVKQHVSFANGLKFAVDVGQVDPSTLNAGP